MSFDRGFLALRLEGPFQSWGFDSQYNRRNTSLMPTKSAIAGLCCAAFGWSRGSHEELVFLAKFRDLRMTAMAIPRNGTGKSLPVRRIQDYHTVQNTRRASGSINNDCVLTYRQYLVDAAFGVILEGDWGLLTEMTTALVDPKRGLWLGRKTCIPSAPVLAGLRKTRGDALYLLIKEKPLESFTRQEEVENFAEGHDFLLDAPVSFDTGHRRFFPRRVKTSQGMIIE